MVGLVVSTYELDDKGKNADLTLTHIFWGKNLKEAVGIARSHAKTDKFFRASLEGSFEWKGSTLQLVNKYNQVQEQQALTGSSSSPAVQRAVKRMLKISRPRQGGSEGGAGKVHVIEWLG